MPFKLGYDKPLGSRGSMLTRDEIMAAMALNEISISDYEPILLKTHSYVLRLGSVWNIVPDDTGCSSIDPTRLNEFRSHVQRFSRDSVAVNPHMLVLNASLETLRLSHKIIGLLTPLGHLSRLGLVNISSMYIHSGFGGQAGLPLIFEFFHILPQPLCLAAGMPFAHLHFITSRSEIRVPDSSSRERIEDGDLFSNYDTSAQLRCLIQGPSQVVKGSSDAS